MNAAWVVLRKECVESLRDRRVLLSVLVFGPLFTPLLFLLMVHLVVGRELEKAEKPLPVAVIGAQNAPGLVEGLRQQGLDARPDIADPEAAVREQRVDLALRIPPRFASDWRDGRPAQVEVIFDSSRQDLRGDVRRLEAMIEVYASRVGAQRLLARGIAPGIPSPIVIATRDQSTPRARGAGLLGMVPYFLILSALIGGMWLAIDSTAGERERRSLEPLLINPVSSGQVITGKCLATALFGFASFLLGILAFTGVAAALPDEEKGLGITIGPSFIVDAIPVMIPLVLLIAVAQVLIASFARSFREAQTYLGLAQLVPLIPSILMLITPVKPDTWMTTVPIVGQQIVLARLLRGELPATSGVLLGGLTTLVLAGIVYWMTLRLYRSERVAISN